MNTLDDSTFIICHVCVYVCHDVYVQVSGLPVHMGFFSFCLVDFRNRTWVFVLDGKHLCPLSHLASPLAHSFTQRSFILSGRSLFRAREVLYQRTFQVLWYDNENSSVKRF